MRRAIGMSGLLAAILAAGPVRAQNSRNEYPVVIMPDGSVLTEESPHIDQTQQLQRQIANDLQQHLSRRFRILPAQWTYAAPAVQKEKAAYMGVATEPVSAVVRDQLQLHKGMGLVIRYVERGSPAAEAGLRQNDVLEKLDDQLLINGPQFAILVRSRKPGDQVTLSIIRGGEHMEVKVTLIEKEVPVLDESGAFPTQPQFTPVMPGPSGVPSEGATPWQHGQRKTVVQNADGSIVRRLANDDYDITLTTPAAPHNNEPTLSIKDRTGKELFSGPYATEEDKARLPANLAPLVKDLAATPPAAPATPPPGQQSAITRDDGQHRITLKQNGTQKRLTVVEVPTNTTLYDGDPDAEEVNQLPADVRSKIKLLEEKTMLPH